MGEDVSCFFCSLGPLALQQRLRCKRQDIWIIFLYISISTEYIYTNINIYIYIDLCPCDLPKCICCDELYNDHSVHLSILIELSSEVWPRPALRNGYLSRKTAMTMMRSSMVRNHHVEEATKSGTCRAVLVVVVRWWNGLVGRCTGNHELWGVAAGFPFSQRLELL